MPRPIARALEDWIDHNWPAVEPLNARQIADHIDVLHLPALADHPASPSNVRTAAAAIGKTLGRAAAATADAAALESLTQRLAAAETTAANRWQAILAAGERIAKRLEALEAAAGIERPAEAAKA